MKISIAPTTGIETVRLREEFDYTAGYLLLALGDYVSELSELQRSGFRKYLDRRAVDVRYSDDASGIGRLEIQPFMIHKNGKQEDIKLTCQPYISNYAKAAICANIYHDVDLADCHTNMLCQICQQDDLAHGALSRYIDERPKIIEETGLCKSDFKKLFFSAVLYTPRATEQQVATKLKTFGLESEPAIFKQLREEVSAATDYFLAKYPCYMQAAIDRKGEDYHNLHGTALSLLMQTCEKRCLLAMYDYFVTHGHTVGALIHDGLHVKKNERLHLNLTACSGHIYKKTGFRMKLAVKQWEPHPAFVDSKICRDMTDCLDHAHAKLEGRLVRCQGRVWFRDESYMWYSGEDVMRKLTNTVSQMHLFAVNLKTDSFYHSISRNVTVQGGIAHQYSVAKKLYETAPEDDDFVDSIRRQTRGKLCFLDGYYDFILGQFVRERVDTLARVPIKFPKRDDAALEQLYTRVIDPIMGELRPSLMSWLSRGVAGCVTDKVWGALLGERNTGKSVLVNALEFALGREIVSTLNAESFMHKVHADTDSAKQMGFLLQVEHARLVFTNEIEIDSSRKQQLNGAVIKRFSSGGDQITARKLYCEPCIFKLSGRLMMCANDMPDVSPSDTVSTLDYFQSPSVFVDPDDARIGKNPMYRVRDDSIKDFIQTEDARAALIWALIEAYAPEPVRTNQMNTMRQEFVAAADDRERFNEMFEITNMHDDVIPVTHVASMVRSRQINATSRRYNRWLKAEGCDVAARATIGHKRVRVIRGIKRKQEGPADVFA